MEQQCAARGAERQIAEFIEDHEVGMDQAAGDLAASSLMSIGAQKGPRIGVQKGPSGGVLCRYAIGGTRAPMTTQP